MTSLADPTFAHLKADTLGFHSIELMTLFYTCPTSRKKKK